jgi:3'-phosphoadenosine 5'-phosphosulfate sulfotransferase (PAPS reductase)/FAD synthetase
MRKTNILPSLKPLIEMSYEDKLPITQVIIERNLRELGKDVAVAWSGGKDSSVVLYMVWKLFPEVPVIFNNTGIEYPETIAYIRKMTKLWNLNLIETKPIKSFFQCVDEYGWPKGKGTYRKGGKDKCCNYLKELPHKKAVKKLGSNGVFDGVTAIESSNRQFHAITDGTCFKPKAQSWLKIHPILYWLDTDVYRFMKENNIPLNEIYFKGANRCGCSCCTAFLSWESQLSRLNPKLYKMVKERKDKQSVMGGIF